MVVSLDAYFRWKDTAGVHHVLVGSEQLPLCTFDKKGKGYIRPRTTPITCMRCMCPDEDDISVCTECGDRMLWLESYSPDEHALLCEACNKHYEGIE